MAVAQPSVEAGVVELQKMRVSMTARKRMWFSLIKNKGALLAAIILTFLIGTALLTYASEAIGFPNQWGITPYDPISQNLSHRLAAPAATCTLSTNLPAGVRPCDPAALAADPSAPTNYYLMGTDKLGRDIQSRLMKGAGVSLFLGFAASMGALTLGVTIGLISGFFGGRLDDVIMRFADVWLAFPALVLFIAIIAVFGTGFWLLLIILAVGGWVTYAKVSRGQVLSAKHKEYVEAARITGASNARIMYRHILPNVVSPLIVISTFSVATIIVVEAGLSFLGLGIQPPQPAWGSMLADGRELLATAWWLAMFPCFCIMLVVLSVNVFGDALRDILDPRLR